MIEAVLQPTNTGERTLSQEEMYPLILKHSGVSESDIEKPMTEEALSEICLDMFASSHSVEWVLMLILAVIEHCKSKNLEPPLGECLDGILEFIWESESKLHGDFNHTEGIRRAFANLASEKAYVEGMKAIEQSNLDGLFGLRDAALIAVASDALLKLSEIRNLKAEDFTKGHITIGGQTIPLEEQSIALLSTWLEVSEITEGPMFVRLWRGADISLQENDSPLSDEGIRKIINARCSAVSSILSGGAEWAKNAGLDASKAFLREVEIERKIGADSLRVGAAASLAAEGKTTKEIQEKGRWKNPNIPREFVKAQRMRRNIIQKHINNQIRVAAIAGE